ncbi:MAG: hypothetical protein JNN04_03820 [Cyclobacteriaceae bacterium]|nr:hypothetical protein [Cyclobacteriaceae bacterium]
MKTYRNISLIFLISLSFPVIAQDLGELAGKLQATLSKVETASATYEQEVKLVEFSTLNYSFKETDKKGVTNTYSTDFNLADIDPYAVREETQKDIIYVVLAAKNKQKVFKTVKNGKTEPYDNELRIHSQNIDQAREVSEMIKKALPSAEKISASKLKVEGYDNMRKWLEEHVGKVSDGTRTYDQTLKEQEHPASFLLLQIESDGKTSHQEEFLFNVADINPNSLFFKVSGNTFGLEFGVMDRLKSIGARRDGQPRPFEDKVLIYTNNADEARDLRTIISMMVPLAQAKVKASLPSVTNANEAIAKLVELVKDVRIGTTTYSQSLTDKCLTTLTITQQTASSASKNTYTFNWMDVNPNLAHLQVSGEKMTMELPIMEKHKLVNHSKDDKAVGYEADASFYVEGMEAGRRVRFLVDKAIGYCKANYKETFPSDTPGMVKWMMSTVGEVSIEQNTIKQALEPVEEGNIDKVKYSRVEIKGTSSTQEVFEFNLSDINPASVNFEVSGKFLTVKFETNFKNKIIKAYKAGKIAPYVYQLEFAMADTESARGMISALKKCAENLKGK